MIVIDLYLVTTAYEAAACTGRDLSETLQEDGYCFWPENKIRSVAGRSSSY